MELEEGKISFRSIKEYISLLKNDIEELNRIEFKTLKEWVVYSLSLVVTICTPCAIVLIITGLLSGGVSAGLLIAISCIPFMFGIPLTFLLTYINNYRKPKYQRKLMLDGLSKYDWDSPIKQVGQTEFECIKNNYPFKTVIRRAKIDRDWSTDVIYMLIAFYYPANRKIENDDINDYLKEKSHFIIEEQAAICGVPLKIFPQVDLSKDIEELLYVLHRFDLRPATFYNPDKILEEVPTTPDVVVWTTFGDDIDDFCIDWANDMISAGFVNDSMKTLAKKTPTPDNQDELKELMNTIISEFNLNVPPKYVLKNYICFLAMREHSDNITVLEAIEGLSYLYELDENVPIFKTFNLLYKAKLALDESGKQDIWDDDTLTAENSDEYILHYLYSLLENDSLIIVE